MNYENLVKRIDTPNGFQAPSELHFDDLDAKPLNRTDLLADMEAVNSSLEIIRNTRGGSWPTSEVTEEIDLLDLAWHEREFRDRNSFAYVIYDNSGNYVGCFYLYGMGVRTLLSHDLLDFQVDVSWWVTTEAFNNGYYQKLRTALDQWLANDFGFTKIYYSNKQQ